MSSVVVTEETVDDDGLARIMAPRDGLVGERALGAGCFEAESGPFRHYRRTVRVEPLPDGRHRVTQTTEFTLAIPWWSWLFRVPMERSLARPDPGLGRQPWWAPPARLDARAAAVLGTLAVASMVAGYLGTLLSQTITFAAREFDAPAREQGVALASVRVGVLLALVLVALADRRGRRLLILVSAAAGCVATATGALAPSLPWLASSQTVARAFSMTLGLVIAIVAAEEMPAGARAYAVSVLAMAASLGAGVCVLALPIADVAEPAWRVLYLVPLLGLPVVASIRRTLPESRRFRRRDASEPRARLGGHTGRLVLLAGSAFLLAVFGTPASQFRNEFLRVERDYSAAAMTAFTVLTTMPGIIGIVIGGRLADVRGRRVVAAVALAGGTAGTVLLYLTAGGAMWAWALAATVVSAATVPALGVYGPELFPTALRGLANGVITVFGVLGGVTGLVAAGFLADWLGAFGTAFALLAVGPAILAVLILVAYPETAGLELEELNPGDEPPPPLPGAGLGGGLTG